MTSRAGDRASGARRGHGRAGARVCRCWSRSPSAWCGCWRSGPPRSAPSTRPARPPGRSPAATPRRAPSAAGSGCAGAGSRVRGRPARRPGHGDRHRPVDGPGGVFEVLPAVELRAKAVAAAEETGVSDERGAATPMVVACLSLLLALGAALGVVAAMVRDHRVAQSAADLAALAGAAALQRGDDACAAAGSVAAANGARLAGCHAEGSDVVVARWSPVRAGSASRATSRRRRGRDPRSDRSAGRARAGRRAGRRRRACRAAGSGCRTSATGRTRGSRRRSRSPGWRPGSRAARPPPRRTRARRTRRRPGCPS